MEERGRHSEGHGKNAEDTRKRRKPSGSARQSKGVEGALWESAGKKARGADEAGRIGWVGIGKFVVPTNQGSGATARLGPSSQQGFGLRARTGWRAAHKAGQAGRQVNTTGNKSCFGCPAPTGAEIGIRNDIQ